MLIVRGKRRVAYGDCTRFPTPTEEINKQLATIF